MSAMDVQPVRDTDGHSPLVPHTEKDSKGVSHRSVAFKLTDEELKDEQSHVSETSTDEPVAIRIPLDTLIPRSFAPSKF